MVIFVRQIHTKWPLKLRLEKVFPFQRAYSRSLPPRFKLRRPGAGIQRDHFWPRACEESWPRCPRAFCARIPVLSAMSALNASAQRGHDDMRGFAGRARIETHHPAKHSEKDSALELEAATRWRTAFTSGLRASCTGGAPVQRA